MQHRRRGPLRLSHHLSDPLPDPTYPIPPPSLSALTGRNEGSPRRPIESAHRRTTIPVNQQGKTGTSTTGPADPEESNSRESGPVNLDPNLDPITAVMARRHCAATASLVTRRHLALHEPRRSRSPPSGEGSAHDPAETEPPESGEDTPEAEELQEPVSSFSPSGNRVNPTVHPSEPRSALEAPADAAFGRAPGDSRPDTDDEAADEDGTA